MFVLRDQSYFKSITYVGGSFRLPVPVYSCLVLDMAGIRIGRVCGEAIKSICSAGLLRDMGYGLQLLRVFRVVRLCDGMEVPIVAYSENGMPFVTLSDVDMLLSLNCFRVNCILPCYPGKHQLMHYHADGGVNIDERIKSFLLKEFGTKVTWSSTDTPELNAVSKRKFRTLWEMTLAMLTESG